MEGTSSATVFFNFLGPLATTLHALCTRHRWILALGNSYWNTRLRPVHPSIPPSVALMPSKPQPLKSLKNSRQLQADSSPPAWNLSTVRRFTSVALVAACTQARSMLLDVHTDHLKKPPGALLHVVDKIQNLRYRDFQLHGWSFSFLLSFVDENLVREKHPFFYSAGIHTRNVALTIRKGNFLSPTTSAV